MLNKKQEKEFNWERKEKERFSTYLSRILKEFGKNPTGENRSMVINQVREAKVRKQKDIVKILLTKQRESMIKVIEEFEDTNLVDAEGVYILKSALLKDLKIYE